MSIVNPHPVHPGIAPAAPATLVDLLRQRAATLPGQRAYLFLEHGETEGSSCTYAELDRRARTVAVALQALGAAGQPVLLCHTPGVEYIAAFFGCLYAGAIAVPASPIDAAGLDRTMPRLQAILADSGATVGLVNSGVAVPAGTAGLSGLRWLATDTLVEGEGWLPPAASASDLALLMYTSGSTGTPKGVMVSHANLLHNLSAFAGYHGRPCRSVVSWLPMYHDLGLLLGVLHPLFYGQLGVLMAPDAFIQRPLRWLRAITRYGASVSAAPNFAYDLCVRKISLEERSGLELSGWTLALNGAEPIRPNTLKRFAAAFAPYGFRAEAFYPSYGMAEATATITGGNAPAASVVRALDRQALQDRQVLPAAEGAPAQVVVGCGVSLPGQQVIAVDPATGLACPPGHVGELWIAGPSVAQGYWRQPEATAATFGARLADSGAGPFLRTGDLGFVEAGEVFLTGRLKDLVIIHGKNHHPEDIEQTVERSHPALRPGCCAAFAIDGEQGEQLALMCEVQAGLPFETAEVLALIRQAVVEHHGVDVAAVALLRPGMIAKTSSGKIQRSACRAAFLSDGLDALVRWQAPPVAEQHPIPVPAGGAPVAEGKSLDTIRTWLWGHLAQRLGLDQQELDPQQPFARYGMASIESVQLASDLSGWLGAQVSPTLPIEYPTIDLLAQHLAGSTVAPSGAAGTADTPGEPIAIVGIGCRFPGAASPAAFWQVLCEGQDTISEVPSDRWNLAELYDPDPRAPGKVMTRWGGFLEGLDQFDAAFFGISPREAAHLDPRQRLMLELAWEALEDAGIPADRLAGSRTGVFVATLRDDYERVLFQDPLRIDAYSGPGNAHSVVANRLSYVLGLQGPSMAVDTACSGSLVALHLACQSLRSGETELALVGGVNVILEPHPTMFFSRAGALAPDGRCKTFDVRANGYVRSEGAGLLVLKPLSRAQADGDTIYALVLGSAVNQDGRTNGIMAPSRQAQEAVLRAAYQHAGVEPAAVQYIEAHGTGTPLGDPIEVQALGAVLAEGRPAGRISLLGSVKTNIGHTEAAAGVAGVIKVALALKHHIIPKNLHYTMPNPLIPFDTLPLRVVEELSAWPDPAAPLIAGVSSFGFGGTNAHVVLAEAPQILAFDPPPEAQHGPYLLPLSARSPAALAQLARASAPLVANAPVLQHLGASAALRRSHLDHRLAVLGGTPDEAAAHLAAFGTGKHLPDLFQGVRRPGSKLVWLFSGQGSQWLNMGRVLMAHEPVAQATLRECDQLIARFAGWSLLEQLNNVEDVRWMETIDRLQPTLFAMQVALANVWRAWGILPDAVVGQSMGEVAAAHVAGALSLADAVRVIVYRSRLMRAVAGHGAMAVLGLPFDQAQLTLIAFDDLLSVAGSDSPGSSVIAGDPAMLERVLASLQRKDVFCRRIAVNVASHSPQMDPLRPQLEAALADLVPQPTSLPLYSTVTAGLIDGRALDAAYWGRNLREPFRFDAVMDTLLSDGHDMFLEVSPHPVLARAVLECCQHAGLDHPVLPSMRRGDTGRTTMLGTLAQLYVQGRDVNWGQLYPAGRFVPLPHYPWQRERYWLDQLAGARPGTTATRRRGGAHPLLGEHTPLAWPHEQHLWELDLSVQSLHYLDDHRVQGRPVLPAAAGLDMALAAAAQLDGAGEPSLHEVMFEQALFLSEQPVRVQLVLAPTAADQARFQLFSRRSEAEAHEPWVRHISGLVRFKAATVASEVPSLLRIRERCNELVSGTAHYRLMQAQGLEYGPSFQALSAIQRRNGEALATLRLPEPLIGDLGAYQIHPALLDAALQVAAATVPEFGQPVEDTYLPVGVDAIRVYRRPGPQLIVHAVLRSGLEAHAEVRQSDVLLLDADGSVLAEVRGLRVQRMGSQQGQGQLHDWLYQLRWQPRERADEPRPAAQPGSWLILADEQGIGERLAALLQGCGEACVLVGAGERYQRTAAGRYQIRPGQSQDYRRLLAEQAQPCAQVVDLWALDIPSDPQASPQAMLDAQLRGPYVLMHLVQALNDAQCSPRLWLVTCNAQPVGEPVLPLAVAQAPLWGAGRALKLEHPELWGGLIDLEPSAPEQAAETVFEALLEPDREDQIAFRQAQRFVARLAPLPAEAPVRPVRFRPDATYLISGGLTGLGLVTARWMVERGARRLLLLNRTALPPRASWRFLDPGSPVSERVAAVRELEALGASVHVAALDVADASGLAVFLETFAAEGWPPIRGVVHSAGLVHDQLLASQDNAGFTAPLLPKIAGTWALHQLLADAPLDFWVVFSSASAVLGQYGQSNYAAGNAFVDALAHSRWVQGLPALTINWGPWSEVGIAARRKLHDQHAQAGVWPISPAQGCWFLDYLFRTQPAQAVVLNAAWEQIIPAYQASGAALFSDLRAPAPEASAAPADDTSQHLLALAPAERQALIAQHLHAFVASVLRLDPERLDRQQSLNALGMDSIMAVELKGRIARTLGLNVPVVAFIDGSSLAALAVRLAASVEAPGEPALAAR